MRLRYLSSKCTTKTQKTISVQWYIRATKRGLNVPFKCLTRSGRSLGELRAPVECLDVARDELVPSLGKDLVKSALERLAREASRSL